MISGDTADYAMDGITIVMFFTVILIIVMLVVAVWRIPYYFARTFRSRYYPDIRADKIAELEAQTRGTIAQIGVGLAVFLGLLLTIASIGLTNRNIQLSEQGQLAERYSRAVGLLSQAAQERGAAQNGDVVARVGGVYALAGVARAEKAYQEPAIRVLTAHIRERSPLRRESGPCHYLKESGENPYGPGPDHVILEPDLTAAISVIGVIAKEMEITDLREVIDLQRSALCFAWGKSRRYAYGWFQRADLRGAILDDADLRCAGLPYADLRGAHLPNADLRFTDLTGADLSLADLTGTRLAGAVLTGADLRGAQNTNREQFEGACGSNVRLPPGLDLNLERADCRNQRATFCEGTL